MSAEEWTPTRGCLTAAAQLTGFSVVAFGLSVGACALLRWLLTALGAQVGVSISFVYWSTIGVFGLPVGILSGWLMARRLVDRSGLSGGGLLMAALLFLAVTAWVAVSVADALAAEWHRIHVVLCIIATLAAGGTAARMLLTD